MTALVLATRVRDPRLVLQVREHKALYRACPSCGAERGQVCMRSGGPDGDPWVWERWRRYHDVPFPSYVCEARR